MASFLLCKTLVTLQCNNAIFIQGTIPAVKSKKTNPVEISFSTWYSVLGFFFNLEFWQMLWNKFSSNIFQVQLRLWISKL